MIAEPAKTVADHTEEIGTMSDIEQMRRRFFMEDVRRAVKIEGDLIEAIANVASAAGCLQSAINSMDDEDDYSFQSGEIAATKQMRNSLLHMKSTMEEVYADVRQYYGERGLA